MSLPKGFRPMLASPADIKLVKWPVFTSPKLDGVRCIVSGGVALSRSLKPIPNAHVQELFGRRDLEGFDGELIVGPPTAKDVFRRTMSGVMSEDGEPEVRFHLFDMVPGTKDPGFQGRLNKAEGSIPAQLEHLVIPVPHWSVESEDEMTEMEELYLRKGFEGLMLRALNGPYKYGRSTAKEGWLLKVKRFVDAEARVLGITEMMHNANEAKRDALGYLERSSKKAGKVGRSMLGALVVEDVRSGVIFEIGTGFTEADRKKLWTDDVIGRLVTYRYIPIGMKDRPRHPSFKGFRDARDT